MQAPPHRKRVKHYEGSCQLHELTFSCYHRMPLLTNDPWRSIMASNLQRACESEQFHLVAFVFMPEHVHLLVLPLAKEARVSRLLARTKQPTSKAIKDLLVSQSSPLVKKLTVQERPGKRCFRFWQEGPGFDRNLFTAEAIEASMNYIHMNPVRRGLCQTCTDWKWSSARFHLQGIQELDLPQLHQADPQWFHRSISQNLTG